MGLFSHAPPGGQGQQALNPQSEASSTANVCSLRYVNHTLQNQYHWSLNCFSDIHENISHSSLKNKKKTKKKQTNMWGERDSLKTTEEAGMNLNFCPTALSIYVFFGLIPKTGEWRVRVTLMNTVGRLQSSRSTVSVSAKCWKAVETYWEAKKKEKKIKAKALPQKTQTNWRTGSHVHYSQSAVIGINLPTGCTEGYI